MKSVVLCSMLLTGVCFSNVPAPAEDAVPAESNAEQFESILDAAVAQGIQALSVRVTWTEGTWAGAAGISSADSADSLGVHSLFRTASITKLFTATVILQLVDEEILSLDDTLADRLTNSPASEVPYADSITVGMLLDHTSGVRSFTDIDEFWDEAYGERGLDRTWLPAELVRYGLAQKPHFEPGKTSEKKYSNSNYILLGMIIEKVTGEPLASAYRQRIYEPLGMTDTLLEGFDSGLKRVQHSFLKSGFKAGYKARRRDWKDAGLGGVYDVSGNYRLYNSWAWAAGGISSTTADLDRFLVGIQDGSLLSVAGQEILFRNNSAEGNAGVVFGGSGGWEGISSSLYEIAGEIRIVVLSNTTGIDFTADKLRGQLYRVLKSVE
jgi:D-alanyl-D-alanine carboxypeptidase